MREICNSPYSFCRLCPRDCGIDRTAGMRGFCGEGSSLRIASAVVHRGEEPPLVTGCGSGTVFFSGCTLKCGFCQNSQISARGMGKEVEPGILTEICHALKTAGASNINLVTGSHFIPGIAGELETLKASGFQLPVVWNSSGFESEEGLSVIAPLVDVWLLDLKTVDKALSKRLFGRPDYPDAAMNAALFASRQGPPEYRSDAMVRGTVIRHLVMPGMEDQTRQVIDWFGEHLAGRALFSLMVQFIDPARGTARGAGGEELQEQLLRWLDAAGVEDGFIQEFGDETDWIPDFTRANPFPGGFADPVWHWNEAIIN